MEDSTNNWERNFAELQEEFAALQANAVNVESYQKEEIKKLCEELEAAKRAHSGLEEERKGLRTRVIEQKDEIRYLQVELEAALNYRQEENDATLEARARTTETIGLIRQAVKKILDNTAGVESIQAL